MLQHAVFSPPDRIKPSESLSACNEVCALLQIHLEGHAGERKRETKEGGRTARRERERERERDTHTHTHTDRQTHGQTHTSIMCTVADTDLTKKVVQDFLSEHFGAAGSDQEPWIPPDFPANATFAHRLTNETLRDWIQSVHDIWPQLGRQTNERLSL